MSAIIIPENLKPLDGHFGCGPSKVRPEQLEALNRRGTGLFGTSHRQAPIKNLVKSVQDQLRALYHLPDDYEVIVGNGGSTAFWDAAVFSLIRERGQFRTFGEFGAKFAKEAKAPFLKAPDIREADAGKSAPYEIVEGVDVYAWPQNETSTGVMVPVEKVDAPDTLTLIDATSSAGGVKVSPTDFDAYYFAPQKNFSSDGGLWFSLTSPAAIARIEEIAASDRWIPQFVDLQTALDNSRKNQTLNTPAIGTLILFDEQLSWILDQGGLDFADARTKKSSDLLYSWAERVEYATPFVEKTEDRSQVVVTIDFNDDVDAAAIAKTLRSNGILDTEPYRKLGRNQLRIATFVSVDPSDIEQLIQSIEYVVERI